MTEVKKDEYIEISLTKMIVSVLKNIKVFLSVFVLGCLLSLACAMMYSPSYNINQFILPPSYLSGDSDVNIIGNSKISVLLNNILKSEQQKSPNDGLLQSIDITSPEVADILNKNSKDILFFSINVKSKEAGLDESDKKFEMLLDKFSNSKTVRKQVELWEENIKYQVSQNNMLLVRVNKDLKQQQSALDNVSSNKDISGTAGQTLVNSYSSRVNATQQRIYDLEDSKYCFKSEIVSS